MSALIELSLHVAAPRGRCFDLSRSVEAHTQSTQATGERAVAGKTHGLLALGDEVTWRARHLGVWQELTSRITAYDRPGHFRDSQVRGAFAHFDHDHFFTATENGTLIREVFEYRAPLGPLGWIAERVFLTNYMRRFLEGRLLALKVIAESPALVQPSGFFTDQDGDVVEHDPHGVPVDTPERDADDAAAHGGRTAWFRVACGFAALGTIGLAYQAWSVARTPNSDTVGYPPSLAGLLALGALLLGMSCVLAYRERAVAGLFLVLGYLTPAIPLYVLHGLAVPPSLFLDASMIALIFATSRRSTRL